MLIGHHCREAKTSSVEGLLFKTSASLSRKVASVDRKTNPGISIPYQYNTTVSLEAKPLIYLRLKQVLMYPIRIRRWLI